MLERIVDKKKLITVKPPIMDIGVFYTFKENNNLLGSGQQAVHNAGSSMVTDTPNFAVKVANFLSEHMEYEADEYYNIIDSFNIDFLKEQAKTLIRFKKDYKFRIKVLDCIFESPFVFKKDISISYIYIVIIFFLIKEYNYFNSTHTAHEITKSSIKKYFSNQEELLKAYYSELLEEDEITYLMDICYGRYYFLEVHFTEIENIRILPQEVMELFFEVGIDKVVNDVYYADELDEEVEQNKIRIVSPYASEKQLKKAENKEPTLRTGEKSEKYVTNAKIAKSAIKNADGKCEFAEVIGIEHETFFTVSGVYYEAHHLIPMREQKNFLPISLDRTENIVSLCPNCHRAIHHGSMEEKKTRIKELYDLRKDKLSEIGINITLEELLLMYGVK